MFRIIKTLSRAKKIQLHNKYWTKYACKNTLLKVFIIFIFLTTAMQNEVFLVENCYKTDYLSRKLHYR